MNGDGALPGCPQPAPGMPLAEALGVEPATARALDARARHGAGVEYVRALPAPGGTPRWLRVGMAPTGRGVEARVHDLDALLEGAPPLQISRLSCSLSHELRNPLSSVKMAVQTLARNDGPLRRGTSAGSPSPTGRSAPWSGCSGCCPSTAARRRSPWTPGALPELVQESAALIEQELAERSIRLELLGVDGAAAGALRRQPPAAGAGAAAAERGLEPRRRASRCAVALRHSDRGAEVEVLDEHAALEPGDERGVFEPFGSRLARGAGLSLAALRRVLQQQGGEVTAVAATPPARGVFFRLDFARAA